MRGLCNVAQVRCTEGNSLGVDGYIGM
jgi:hypothetical protein